MRFIKKKKAKKRVSFDAYFGFGPNRQLTTAEERRTMAICPKLSRIEVAQNKV